MSLNSNNIFPYLYNVPIIYPDSIFEINKNALYTIKFSFDGEYCMTSSKDNSVKLINPFKKIMIKSYDNIHNNDILDFCIFNDNSKFSSVGIEKQVFVTDSIKCSVIRKFFGHLDRINTICLNIDESVLISGSHDCSIRLWDLRSQSKEPIQVLIEAFDSITKILTTSNYIISISIDGFIRIYDIRIGKLHCINMMIGLNGVDISKDKNYLCVSGIDECIRLIEINTGKILKVFAGLHISKNYSKVVKFSYDNSGIYVTSENNDIVYYDLIDEKKDIILRGHLNISSGFDLNKNKRNIGISSGFDGNVLLWKLKSD